MIDKTPKEYDIVVQHLVTKEVWLGNIVGYARHDINFTFVEVDKYEGEGTGPAYSINQCKEHLKDHLFGLQHYYYLR